MSGITNNCAMAERFVSAREIAPLTKENYENFIAELCIDGEEMLDQFTRLYTWGYCSLWKYVTSEYSEQRSFIHMCLCFFNKYKNAASIG